MFYFFNFERYGFIVENFESISKKKKMQETKLKVACNFALER